MVANLDVEICSYPDGCTSIRIVRESSEFEEIGSLFYVNGVYVKKKVANHHLNRCLLNFNFL